MPDIDITQGRKTIAPSEPSIVPADQSDRVNPIIKPDPGAVILDRDYFPQIPESDPPDIDWSVIIDPDYGEDSGVPGEPIPDPGEVQYNPGVEYVISDSVDFWIVDFSAEAIAEYQESGAIPIAVYDDGTEAETTWSQVSKVIPDPEEIQFDWTYADNLFEAASGALEDFKQDAADTYTTETYVDKKTGALSRTVSQTYATKAENLASTHSNLYPFFAHDFSDIYDATDNPGGYYSNDLTTGNPYATQLEDGWIHIYGDNSSGTSAKRHDVDFRPKLPVIEEGTPYTFLIETRNNQSSGIARPGNLYIVQANNLQFWGAATVTDQSEGPNPNYGGVYIYNDGSSVTKHFVKVSEATGSSRWPSGPSGVYGLLRFTFYVLGGGILDVEMRLSMYVNGYLGAYKPYIVPDKSLVTKSYFRQEAGKIEAGVQTRFDTLDAKTDNLQDQIDGHTSTWYGTVVPTLNNTPANAWTTEALKLEHQGDLYFRTDTNQAYRFLKNENDVWGWQEIPASDAQKALAEIEEIKTTYVKESDLELEDGYFHVQLRETLDAAKDYTDTGVEAVSGQYNSLIEQFPDKVELAVQGKYATKVENNTSTQPNITPFFSKTFDDYYNASTKPKAYWRATHLGAGKNGSSTGTEGFKGMWSDSTKDPTPWPEVLVNDGGWAHITFDSRTSAGNQNKNCFMNLYINYDKIRIKPSKKYTWLVEVENLTLDKTENPSGVLVVCPSVGNATLDKLSSANVESMQITQNGSYRCVVTAKSNFDGLARTHDTRGYAYCNTGISADFWCRVSLYEGEYTGEYKPYIEDLLWQYSEYATKSEIQIEKDRITSTVAESKLGNQGGVNILVNTNIEGYFGTVSTWSSGTWLLDSGGNGTGEVFELTDSPEPGIITHGFRIKNNTSGNRDIQQQQVPVLPEEDYTVGVWARRSEGVTKGNLMVRFWATSGQEATGNQGQLNGTLTNEWQWFEKTIKIASNLTRINVLFGTSGDSPSIELCGFSLIRENSKIKSLETVVTQTSQGVQTAITNAANAVTTANNAQEDADAAVSAANNAIKAVDVEYAKNNSSTTAPTSPSDWSTTAPTWENGKYIWTRTKTTTNNGSSYSQPTCISGAKGDQGKSISTITEYYAINNSGTTAPADSAFSTGIKTPTNDNKYLWNYELITYTDNSTSKLTKHIAAVYGLKGDQGLTGNGISSITEYYAINNTTTAPGDSSFTTTVKTPTSSNRYLWNYEVVTYTNNSTEKTAKRVIGVYGEKGNTGTGVSDIVEQYYLSSSNSSQTGGSWQETQPTWKANYYIWTRSQISWDDGTVTYTNPILADAVNKANTVANTANVTANTANTTANTAKSTATTAKTTADAAKTAADNATADVATIKTIIRQYSAGVLVGRTGNTVGALVNSTGEFDIVPITWSGDEPTANLDDAKKYTLIGQSSVRIGQLTDANGADANNISISQSGIYFRRNTALLGFMTPTSAQLGNSDQKNIRLTTSGIHFHNANTVLGSLTPTVIQLGETSDTSYNVNISKTGTAAGVYLRSGTTNLAAFTSVNMQIGTNAGKRIYVDTTGISFKDGNTELGYFKPDAVGLGTDAAKNVRLTTNGLYLRDGSTIVGWFQSNSVQLGNSAQKWVQLNTNGVYLKDGSVSPNIDLAAFTPTAVQLGSTVGTTKNVNISSNGIYLREGATNLAYFTPTVAQIGKATGKNINLSSSGVYLQDGTDILAAFTPTQIALAGAYNLSLWSYKDHAGDTIVSSLMESIKGPFTIRSGAIQVDTNKTGRAVIDSYYSVIVGSNTRSLGLNIGLQHNDAYINRIAFYGYESGASAIRYSATSHTFIGNVFIEDGTLRGYLDLNTSSNQTMQSSLFQKFSNIDASLADNGVTSTLYPTSFSVSDKNSKILARMEARVLASGAIGSKWYVRNYDSNGTLLATKGIQMDMDKDANLTYTVSDPAKFRTALGLGSSALVNVSDIESLGSGSAIAANTNLNSIMSIGNYHVAATSNAQTILNRPPGCEVAFTMKVGNATGTGYRYQEVRAYNSNLVWYRENTTTSDTSKWQAWEVKSGRVVLSNTPRASLAIVEFAYKASLFKHLTIYYTLNGKTISKASPLFSVDVYEPNGKTVTLHGCFMATDTIAQYKFRTITINDEYIPASATSYFNVQGNGIGLTPVDQNYNLWIQRVEGW